MRVWVADCNLVVFLLSVTRGVLPNGLVGLENFTFGGVIEEKRFSISQVLHILPPKIWLVAKQSASISSSGKNCTPLRGRNTQ